MGSGTGAASRTLVRTRDSTGPPRGARAQAGQRAAVRVLAASDRGGKASDAGVNETVLIAHRRAGAQPWCSSRCSASGSSCNCSRSSDADYRAVAAAGARGPGRRGALHGGPSVPASSFRRICRWWPTSATRPTTSSTPADLGAGQRTAPAHEADFRRSFLPDRTPVGTPQDTYTPYRNDRAREWAFRWSRPSTGCRISVEGPAGAAAALPPLGQPRAVPLRCVGGGRLARGALPAGPLPVRASPSGGRTLSLTLPDGPAADALLLEAGITWEHAWFPDRRCAPPPRSPRARGFVGGETPAAASDRGPCWLTTANPDRQLCLRSGLWEARHEPRARAWTVASPSDWAWCALRGALGHRAPGGVRARRASTSLRPSSSHAGGRCSSAPGGGAERRVITQAFDFNHEHPMLAKSLFGWSHTLFHQVLGWVRPAAGFRLPAFAWRAHSRAAPSLRLGAVGPAGGVVRRALLLRRPAHFFHAHLSCFDMPVAAMWLLVVYLFWRAEEDLRLAPGPASPSAWRWPPSTMPSSCRWSSLLRSARGLAQREHGGRRLLVRTPPWPSSPIWVWS